MVLTSLPLFEEVKTIATPGSSGVVLSEEDEVKLILLNEALSDSKAKGKSTYTTWVNYFTEGAEVKSGIVLEAILAFWLS